MSSKGLIRLSVQTAALSVAVSSIASAQTLLLSDSFSRAATPGTPVGTPPSRDASATAQAAAATNWVSDWGQNNNYAGGSITQTYVTYKGLDGAGVQRNFKVDGTNGISGNWLNNGSTAHPLKSTGSTDTFTEPIGITGFAWTQIDHDFANDPTVQAAEKLRVSFDMYRTAAGNQSFFIGNSDPTGVVNGNAGSPAVISANDIGLYFRGVQANTFGLRDNGALPATVTGIANYDTISYAAGTVLNPQPIPVQIDITGTDFLSGTSVLELWVGGVQQDLNGTDVAGMGYTFTWDGGTAAYMGFASNNTPVEGTAASPVYRRQGIDNLKVLAIPAPVPTWTVDADGNWDAAANWSTNSVPNGPTVTATLGGVVTAPRRVTLQSNVTLDKLVVSSGTGSYVIDSPSSSRLAVGTIDIQAGRLDLDDSGNTDSVTVTNTLSIATGATLNLQNGALVVNSTPLSNVVDDIKTGRLTGNSNAVAAVLASDLSTLVFRGVSVSSTSVLVIRTLPGDANLDQSVSFNDLLALAKNYNATTNTSWARGDFDYNGAVNFNDLLALARSYNGSVVVEGLSSDFAADWALARSLVPEPATLSLILPASALLRRRRR